MGTTLGVAMGVMVGIIAVIVILGLLFVMFLGSFFEGFSQDIKSNQPTTETKFIDTPESMANQKQCEDIDGLWGIWSNRSPATASCNPSTSDGGKECSDSSQCQSFCQAKEGAQIGIEDTGMCYESEFAICMQEVRNGVVDAEWCQ